MDEAFNNNRIFINKIRQIIEQQMEESFLLIGHKAQRIFDEIPSFRKLDSNIVRQIVNSYFRNIQTNTINYLNNILLNNMSNNDISINLEQELMRPFDEYFNVEIKKSLSICSNNFANDFKQYFPKNIFENNELNYNFNNISKIIVNEISTTIIDTSIKITKIYQSLLNEYIHNYKKNNSIQKTDSKTNIVLENIQNELSNHSYINALLKSLKNEKENNNEITKEIDNIILEVVEKNLFSYYNEGNPQLFDIDELLNTLDISNLSENQEILKTEIKKFYIENCTKKDSHTFNR